MDRLTNSLIGQTDRASSPLAAGDPEGDLS
jgi:hypothetical protein